MQTYVYTTCRLPGKAGLVGAGSRRCSFRARECSVTGESATDDETVMLCLRVPAALKTRLTSMSMEAGVTIQSIGRRAIEIELDTREAMAADAAEREVAIRERIRSTGSHQSE